MADVRRPPDRPQSAPDRRRSVKTGPQRAVGVARGDSAGRRRGDDRGQLLLVGSLALAVVFVSLALLLNTAIYTGNLATRDAGVDAGPAVEYVSESRSAGVDAVASVNRRNNTSAADLTRAFDATMTRWDDLAAHHRAVAGDVTAVDVAGVTNGTRIQQDDASRDFTNASGAENWSVASGVSDVRSVRLTVDGAVLADSPSDFVADEVFHINVTDDDGTRSAYVYDTGSGPEVRVVDGGTATTCSAGSAPDETVVVDVSNASVGGAPCPALGGLDDTAGTASVDYRDAGAAGGTYTMVVDEPPSNLSLSGLNAAGSGSPYWTYAIHSAELTVTYRTDELDYEATVGVVPE